MRQGAQNLDRPPSPAVMTVSLELELEFELTTCLLYDCKQSLIFSVL